MSFKSNVMVALLLISLVLQLLVPVAPGFLSLFAPTQHSYTHTSI